MILGGAKSKGDAAADALAFLERFLQDNPALAQDTWAREVDNLLGRPAAREVSPRGRRASAAAYETDDDSPGFGWYQELLSRVPVLDEGRVELAAARVEAGLLAEERLAERGDEISSADRLDLYEMVRIGREEWNWLVLANIRLVFHWSKGVARSIDSDWAQDAFQVGCLGLIRGLQGWDYRLGYKLSTFVSWHIRQAIQRWRANDVLIIRLPVHVWEALGSQDSDLSSAVRAAVERATNLESLEAKLLDRGEDIAWSGGIDAIDEIIDRSRLAERLLGGLDDRSRGILESRFGFFDEPMTLDQIGAVWGVTRERIRQLEHKALTSLRERLGIPSTK